MSVKTQPDRLFFSDDVRLTARQEISIELFFLLFLIYIKANRFHQEFRTYGQAVGPKGE